MAENIAYFSKVDPAVKLHIGDGGWLHFTDVGNNVGILVTNKPQYIAEIRGCVQRGVGGVTEISASQYQELQKKKNQPSSTILREQVSAQQIRDIARSRRGAELAGDDNGLVEASSGSRGRREGGISPIEYKPVVPGFKPSSVKR